MPLVALVEAPAVALDRLAADMVELHVLGHGGILARRVRVAQHGEDFLAPAQVVAGMRAAEGAAEDAIVDEDGAHVAVHPWHANDNDVLALDGL